MKSRILAGCLLAFSYTSSALACENGELYVGQKNSASEGYSLTTRFSTSGPFIFEKWQGKTHIWTVEGEFGCSNGVPICGLLLGDNEEGIDILVESLEASNGERFYIFTHLSQTLHSKYRWNEAYEVKATWHVERAAQEDQQVILPNIFRFESCR